MAAGSRQEVAAPYAVEVGGKGEGRNNSTLDDGQYLYLSRLWGRIPLIDINHLRVHVYTTDSKHEACGPAARSVAAYNGACMKQTYHLSQEKKEKKD